MPATARLRRSQDELSSRRTTLVALAEGRRIAASRTSGTAARERSRALALAEEAHTLDELVGGFDANAALRQRLAARRQREHGALRARGIVLHRVRLQPLRQGERRVHHRHLIAPALLARGHGHGLPVLALFVGALAFEFEHAALGQQRCEAGSAQLGGLFYQPVHAFVGGDTGQQVHGAVQLALQRGVLQHAHVDVAAPHLQNLRLPLPACASEQFNDRARLQAQHLHVARSAGG